VAPWLREWWSGHHRRMTPAGVLAAVILGAALAVAAMVAVAWDAGFHHVLHVVSGLNWKWLPLVAGLVAASHLGYVLAYRPIVCSIADSAVPVPRVGAAVVAGFGPLSPRPGFVLDSGLWRDAGLDAEKSAALVRLLVLMEYAVLGPATFVAALVLYSEGYRAQSGLLPSWVLGVPIGAVVTLGLIAVRHRLPDWRALSALKRGLDAVVGVWRLLRTRAGVVAAMGMALYWAADIAAFGVCLAVVHHGGIPIAVLIVGYATGYALTRRSLPLAGAGAVEALLPFAMSWVSRPLGIALVAVFAYRLINLWLPLAPAVLALRHLRDVPHSAPATAADPEPATA
jgi:hypothetical protein